MTTTLAGTVRLTPVGYRGRCKYKSGRCPNERTLKYNGEEIHSLCEEHRVRHNRNQRKADTKRRKGCVDGDNVMPSWTPTSPRAAQAITGCPMSAMNHDGLFHQPSLLLANGMDDDAFANITMDTAYVASVDDMDLYFQEDYPTWSSEDVAILMEFFVDSKC
ncbi:hypothetical protein DYB32_002526 [Aphanomyces invadans]|uniref:Uncharacterized protein n=1 Tax=Aphanomyces invadans TaxID=157072 RepID=A0A418B3B0_9STRA|nr:hypothetical protein DYB32_002526 [Aphanomyces invadans]